MIPNGRDSSGNIAAASADGRKAKNDFFDFIRYLKELVQEAKFRCPELTMPVRRILTIKFADEFIREERNR